MSIRSRLTGLALAAAAVASMGLAAAPAASAAPAGAHHVAAQTKYFGMHLRLHDAGPAYPGSLNCYRSHRWSWSDSSCYIKAAGVFDGGHAGPDAGFAGQLASISYGPDGKGGTYLYFASRDDKYFVKGTVPGRGSGDYTIESINVPGGFGKVVSNKLSLRVETEGPGLTGDAWQDFYLTGNVQVETSAVGGGAGNPFAGLFGSS
ncbi:hypothetical protein [Williamsia deligens]|uniref:Glycosyl hydrolase family 98 putative carbohydrate-binding module domain-containing protein n=1 Tax=Williamsia deligens TaxID=321325 RepID=A0ABW3G433_9NOCA|nr:hypothetical protein [Williamsia deligens]MCP2194271.1 hypothetical protein [Williamsia deligens]